MTTPTADEAIEQLLTTWDRLRGLTTRFAATAEQELGVPTHRVHVLGAVEGGATRIHEVATASATSVSAASRTVDGLVHDGLLDRAPDPEDRRASHVTLTRDGRAVLQQLRGWAVPMVRAVVDDLGPARAARMADDLDAFVRGLDDQLDERG